MRIKRTILAAFITGVLSLAFAGCAASGFVIISEDDFHAEITAENAGAGTAGSVGALTIGEGEIILIEPALKKGTIEVRFAPLSGAEDVDADSEELLEQTDAVFTKEVSGTEAVECALDAGDYMITTTVLRKATGTVDIRVSDKE